METASVLHLDGTMDFEPNTDSSRDDPTHPGHPISSGIISEAIEPQFQQARPSDTAEVLDDTKDTIEEIAVANKAEQRRRMDEIVKDHILDLHVYDKPISRRRSARPIRLDNQFLMSGALPIPGSALPNDSNPPDTPAMADNVVAENSLLSSPTLHTKQAQRLSMAHVNTKPVPIRRPRPQVLAPKRIPKVMPVFAPIVSEKLEDPKTSSPVVARKETPIPAPQPWKTILPSSGSSGGAVRSPH